MRMEKTTTNTTLHVLHVQNIIATRPHMHMIAYGSGESSHGIVETRLLLKFLERHNIHSVSARSGFIQLHGLTWIAESSLASPVVDLLLCSASQLWCAI